jgi:predicted ATPase
LLEQGDSGKSIERALRLTVALSWFWFVRGLDSEGRQWLEQVFEPPPIW